MPAQTEPTRDEGARAFAAPPAASRAYANYVLGVLFVVYVFNFIDRQVLAILLQPIKQDLGVSDTAMGFLSGFAFALFYTAAGIPIARLADRTSRRTIIAVGLAVWSCMTAASGLSRSFAQLALARVGVGVGEAAGSPPAHSLISDYFPPERRATALAIYGTGIYVGAALAFALGGRIVQSFDWRTVFLAVGLPGIPLALLVRLTVREPPRGLSEGARGAEAQVPFREVVRYLFARRTFVWLVTAVSFQSLSGYAVLGWGPTFLIRVHGMGYAEVGLWLGLMIGLCGAGGAWLGGRISDRLSLRDVRWYMWVSALVTASSAPFGVAFVMIGETRLALWCFVPFYTLAAMYLGPMFWVVQGLVQLRMRATASAILLFIVNLIGAGAGPFVVGFLNDTFAASVGDEGVRYSLLLMLALGPVASVAFVLAGRRLREDLALEPPR
jgi:predicted MFS family arabinose efflux permease